MIEDMTGRSDVSAQTVLVVGESLSVEQGSPIFLRLDSYCLVQIHAKVYQMPV